MAEIKEVAAVEYRVWPHAAVRPAVRPAARTTVYYPESDGKPMAETDTHINLLIYLHQALADYFRNDPNVYVAGNLFVYYQKGVPTKVVAPDNFVVKGVPKHNRRIYKVWEEGKSPDVVFELTSRSTRREDLGSKKDIYERMGVDEYFIFDPLGEHLTPRLVGFRLTARGYQPIEGEEPLMSRVLGLELRVEGEMLRLVDPATGEKLLTPLEAQEARRAETQARRAEAQARRRAEAEVEQLRAELARLRAADEAKEKRQ